MHRIHSFISTLMVLFAGFSVSAHAAAPSAYNLFKPSQFSDVELSPSGRYLAYLMVDSQKYCFDDDGQMVKLELSGCGDKYKKYRSTYQVKIYDLKESKFVQSIPVPINFVIDWLEWASDDYLLAALRSPFTVGRDGRGYTPGASRVVSFPRAGGDLTPLFEGKGTLVRQNQYMSRITNTLRSDPNHVLMPANNGGNLDLWKVNVINGKAEVVAEGRADTFIWFTDNDGAPVLRFDCKNDRCRTIYVYSKTSGGEWEKFKTLKRKPYEPLEDMDFWPIAPAEKPGQYYMMSREYDSPRRSVRIYDLNTKSYAETVYEHPIYDVGGALLDLQTGAYAGAFFTADRIQYALKNETQQKHIDALNAYFENMENLRILGYNADGTQLTFYVSAFNNPGEYYIYDFKTQQVERLFRRNPDLSDRLPTQGDILSIKTRDGENITAYHSYASSIPLSNQPLLVMPHGGPEARDNFDYTERMQYFTTRGYQVLQVNFRGSYGYGRAFAEAGYGEWGGVMQNDVTDAVKYLFEKGTASPSKTCIVGYSYGGYVALYGGATTPELYKCVVSGGGLSDIVADLKRTKVEYGSDSAVFEFWEKSMGTLKDHQDTLDAVSPINLADKFKAPVLLIHAEFDTTVYPSQSEDMRTKLKKAGKSVTYLELKDEGHNGWSVESEILYHETVEKFVAKHLK